MNMSTKQEADLEEHLEEDHSTLPRLDHSLNHARYKTDRSKNEPQIGKLSSRLKIYPNSEFERNNEAESFIGSGNFSIVHKYHHKDLKKVAIKQFKVTGSARTVQKAWEMVQREANVLCRFQHPNIVKILGITQWLTEEVKLADFGSAALYQATGASATTLDIAPSKQHTLQYAAPELLKDLSRERNPAMDMYSFGSILYELITGRAPYSNFPMPAALLELITAGNKPNLKLVTEVENGVDTPEDRSDFDFLKDLMERCWMSNPHLRPSSKTVENEMKNYMEKKSLQPQLPGPSPRGSPPVESFEEATLNKIENEPVASSRRLFHTEDEIPAIVDERRLSSLRTFLKECSIPWNSLFEVDVKVRYGETEVSRFSLDLSLGKRLSYGNVAMQEHVTSIMRRRATGFNFTSVEMPSYNGSNKKVKEVLDKTDLGFTLTVDQNAVLHVTRLCHSQMFYFESGSDASTSAVQLERYKRVELFSYKKFVDELLEQKRDSIKIRPHTEIRLFIGAKPRSPSSRGIVCVTIEPAAVERIYEKFIFF